MTGPLVPFRQLVLKVHSRCDLACRHCYVYEHADQSWAARPKVISDETITWTANRLAEHAKTHALPSVHVILHGGEPLLAGPARLRRVCEELRAGLAGISELDLRIHTNGVQLSERYLDLFDEFDVKVGISLDGDKVANDRHRLYANGRSSHQEVLAAVALLRRERYRHLYAGLLCTIDVANDPIAVYDALVELDPPRIDFLLPHATWDEPPVRPEGAPTAYADWLLAIFDRWDAQGRPVPIRLFDSVISTLGGGPSLTESMGLAPADLVVIETDGTVEQADSLKTAYDGAPATGFAVFTDSLDAAALHPGVVARQQGLAGLSAECRACPVVQSCGGGLYAHRYRSDNGFDNPSAYCEDLKSLVMQVSSRVERPPLSVSDTRAHSPVLAALPGVGALADGTDDGTAVRQLASAQRNLTRRWLALVDDAVSEKDGDKGGELRDQSRRLLAELEETPGGLDALLAHPYTRAWAVESYDALSRPRHGDAVRAGDPVGASDLVTASGAAVAHLAALTTSAALRAGLRRELTVPVGADGTLILPTLGRVRFRAPGERFAHVVADGSGFTISCAGEEVVVGAGASPDQRWAPVRHLTVDLAASPAVDNAGRDTGQVASRDANRRDAGRAFGMALDDSDPYRDCFPLPALPALTGRQFAMWQDTFTRAWQLLLSTVPTRAAALAAGLTTVTPLAAAAGPTPSPGAGVTLAGGRRGMGAVGLALTDAEGLARHLLSGFQHATLDALLEQCELYDEADARSFPVPWGGDAVPPGELLARSFARTATTAFAARPREHAAATARALDLLISSGTLTAEGLRFTERALAASDLDA
jgi:uncharacterized protein